MAKVNFEVLKPVKAFGTKAYMKISKVSPELALGGAIICGVGAIVAACFASRKVDAVIQEAHSELDDIQKQMTDENASEERIKELKKETLNCYIHTGADLAKLYGFTIALGATSVGLMLASHGILNKRYVGTVAAYRTLDEAFKGYRKRVAEAIGEDAEKILMAGGKMEKGIKVEDEEGNVEKLTGQNLVIQEHGQSPYEFDFNRHTAPLTWTPNADYNEAYLRNIQNYFNDLLQTRGHVFLNEILDQLGLQRTPAGAVCGWIKGAGDDYIDFGYMQSFMRDWKIDSDLCKKNIHLNFNVDGPIFDMI